MKIKCMMLLGWALLIPVFNYGMIKEEVKKQKTEETQVTTVFTIKNEIQQQINQLYKFLTEYKENQNFNYWDTELAKLFNNIDPSKKGILTQIRTNNVLKNNKEIKLLTVDISDNINKIPHAMIEAKIKEYFESTIKIGSVIEIKDKGEGNGVQFGKIAFVKTGNGNILQYYVKTHQLGLLSQTGRSAQSVDLKEPFAYKFLELCGIAPEVHFFYDDDKYFYIATKNEGYSFKGETEFLTYDKVLSKEETKISIYDNQKLLDYAFLMTDFYSRLLNLSDVLANHGNVGFIKKGYDFIDFKIIDFRVPDTRERYKLKNIIGGWIDGNNEYNYSDKYVVELLKNKNVKEKQLKILPYIKKDIPELIKKACDQILGIGQQVFIKDDKFDGYAKDLINYAETVQTHYKELYEGIQSKLE